LRPAIAPQDPADRRQILCDAAMRRCFGADVASFTMFSMAKHVRTKEEPCAYLRMTSRAMPWSDYVTAPVLTSCVTQFTWGVTIYAT
jgi:hypothetical protein